MYYQVSSWIMSLFWLALALFRLADLVRFIFTQPDISDNLLSISREIPEGLVHTVIFAILAVSCFPVRSQLSERDKTLRKVGAGFGLGSLVVFNVGTVVLTFHLREWILLILEVVLLVCLAMQYEVFQSLRKSSKQET